MGRHGPSPARGGDWGQRWSRCAHAGSFPPGTIRTDKNAARPNWFQWPPVCLPGPREGDSNEAATRSSVRGRNGHGVKSRLCTTAIAERRQNARSSRRHQSGGHLRVSAPGPVTSSSLRACRASIPGPTRWCRIPRARIRQALLNLKLIAQSEGATLQDCVRITVYVSDLHRFAPMVDKAQAELWGKPPYPPRTMVEVQRLFDDDIVEIDSVFYAPAKK